MVNWKVRYAKLIEKNPSLLDSSFSVLEVGSGDFGISEYIKRKVTALELNFSTTPGKWIDPVVGSILNNNFTDGQFDYVICVDVIEHLKKDDRSKALKELLRIAKHKVLLSFPCGDIARWGDENYAAQLQALGILAPPWLQEHLENGFPALIEVVELIKQTQHHFELTGNEGMMQHYGGILLDQFFFKASNQLLAMHSNKAINEAPIVDSEWDLYYSFLFSIDAKSTAEKIHRKSSLRPNNFTNDGSIKIYSAFHIPIPLGHFGDISPLAIGDIAPSFADSTYPTDILNDGTRLNNTRWSELSGIFKVWKEIPSAYVGFCHYRRVFDLRFEREISERTTCISLEQLPNNLMHFGNHFLSLLNDDSIFLPKPIIFDTTIFDQYHSYHKVNDLCLIIKILEDEFPELYKFTSVIFESNELYANNMFITSWENFDELCQIWFRVLSIFESIPKNKDANRYQTRDISFLAERIFTIWIHYKKAKGNNIMHIPIFHIEYPGLSAANWSATS